MTTVDTSRYTPRDIAISIQIDLENMPEVPTLYGAKGIIVREAVVTFDLFSGLGLPEFRRCQLSGWVPLKSGGPSRSPQSDDYGTWNSDRMPEPIKQVVAYAQTLVLGMLK